MYLLRAFAVWLLLIGVESAHGVLRALFLEPYVGELPARRMGFFVGALIVLGVACLSVRWIRAGTTARLVAVGVLWLCLTLAFELWLGRFVMGLSWDRLALEYDVTRGALMPFGLLLVALAPLIAARLRGLTPVGSVAVLHPLNEVESGPAVRLPGSSNDG